MFTRRNFTQAVGLLGLASLAGCLDTARASDDPKLDAEPDYGDWFDGVSNYDGTYDYRGGTGPIVEVGASGDLGFYKFSPAAVAVSPGATVTWRWTGKGGAHDVRAADGSFGSGEPVDHAGHTFSHTFDAPGVYTYYCTPHGSMGMRGAVYVAPAE